MTEHQFWATYFLLIGDYLNKGGGPAEAAGTPRAVESPGVSADGGKSTAAPSALTAWEDLQRDEAGSAPSPNNAAPPADDLDKYLQVHNSRLLLQLPCEAASFQTALILAQLLLAEASALSSSMLCSV
jgi:hypothetical protein